MKCTGTLVLIALAIAHVAVAQTPDTPSAPIPAAVLEPPADSVQTLSNACYRQSLGPAGDPASCDVLIQQAEQQGLAPDLLAAAYTSRGLILSRQASEPEELQAVYSDYEMAAQLAPERPEPLLNQANLLLQAGEAAEALALYDNILSRAGTATAYHAVTLHNRALAYRALGELDQAHADLVAARALADQAIPAIQAGAPAPPVR